MASEEEILRLVKKIIKGEMKLDEVSDEIKEQVKKVLVKETTKKTISSTLGPLIIKILVCAVLACLIIGVIMLVYTMLMEMIGAILGLLEGGIKRTLYKYAGASSTIYITEKEIQSARESIAEMGVDFDEIGYISDEYFNAGNTIEYKNEFTGNGSPTITIDLDSIFKVDDSSLSLTPAGEAYRYIEALEKELEIYPEDKRISKTSFDNRKDKENKYSSTHYIDDGYEMSPIDNLYAYYMEIKDKFINFAIKEYLIAEEDTKTFNRSITLTGDKASITARLYRSGMNNVVNELVVEDNIDNIMDQANDLVNELSGGLDLILDDEGNFYVTVPYSFAVYDFGKFFELLSIANPYYQSGVDLLKSTLEEAAKTRIKEKISENTELGDTNTATAEKSARRSDLQRQINLLTAESNTLTDAIAIYTDNYNVAVANRVRAKTAYDEAAKKLIDYKEAKEIREAAEAVEPNIDKGLISEAIKAIAIYTDISNTSNTDPNYLDKIKNILNSIKELTVVVTENPPTKPEEIYTGDLSTEESDELSNKLNDLKAKMMLLFETNFSGRPNFPDEYSDIQLKFRITMLLCRI